MKSCYSVFFYPATRNIHSTPETSSPMSLRPLSVTERGRPYKRKWPQSGEQVGAVISSDAKRRKCIRQDIRSQGSNRVYSVSDHRPDKSPLSTAGAEPRLILFGKQVSPKGHSKKSKRTIHLISGLRALALVHSTASLALSRRCLARCSMPLMFCGFTHRRSAN